MTAKDGVPASWMALPTADGEEETYAVTEVPSATKPGTTKSLTVLRDHPRGRRVMLVDDVAGTGSALIGLALLASACGAEVHSAFVFVEKKKKG